MKNQEIVEKFLEIFPKYQRFEKYLLSSKDDILAYCIFHTLFKREFLEYPLQQIEDIKYFYKEIIQKFSLEFPIIKPIINNEKNRDFLDSILKGAELLFQEAKKLSVEKVNLYNFALQKAYIYLDHSEVSDLITFVRPGTTYTSLSFMKKHIEVVHNLNEVLKNNNLYAYQFDNHWYLVLKEGEENTLNVIDIRVNTYLFKSNFLKNHKNHLINYVELSIQEKIEHINEVEGSCGKICLAINNLLVDKTLAAIISLPNLLKTDLNFCKNFISKTIGFINLYGPIEYKLEDGCIKEDFIWGVNFNKANESELLKIMGENSEEPNYCIIL